MGNCAITPPSPCEGLTGFELSYCEDTIKLYANWTQIYGVGYVIGTTVADKIRADTGLFGRVEDQLLNVYSTVYILQILPLFIVGFILILIIFVALDWSTWAITAILVLFIFACGLSVVLPLLASRNSILQIRDELESSLTNLFTDEEITALGTNILCTINEDVIPPTPPAKAA